MGFESAARLGSQAWLGSMHFDDLGLIDLLRNSRAEFYSSRKANFDSLRPHWDEHNQRRAKEFASANKN